MGGEVGGEEGGGGAGVLLYCTNAGERDDVVGEVLVEARGERLVMPEPGEGGGESTNRGRGEGGCQGSVREGGEGGEVGG